MVVPSLRVVNSPRIPCVSLGAFASSVPEGGRRVAIEAVGRGLLTVSSGGMGGSGHWRTYSRIQRPRSEYCYRLTGFRLVRNGPRLSSVGNFTVLGLQGGRRGALFRPPVQPREGESPAQPFHFVPQFTLWFVSIRGGSGISGAICSRVEDPGDCWQRSRGPALPRRRGIDAPLIGVELQSTGEGSPSLSA